MIAFLAAASLATTTIDPQASAILDRAKAAAGGVAIQALGPYELDENVSWGRLNGTATFVCDPKSGEWMHRESIGKLIDADGFDGSQVWTQDSTGDTWPVVDRSQIASAFETAYLCSFAYWFPDRMPPVKISMASAIEADDATADTIAVALPDLDWLYLSFDKNTRLLKRVAWSRFTDVLPTETDYGDYRDVGGAMIAFSRTSKSSRPKSHIYYARVKSASLDSSAPAQVAFQPAHLNDVRIAPSPQPVRVEMTGGRAYVDVRINGKGPFKFIIDTAQTDHVSSKVAAQLHLTDESGTPISAKEPKPTAHFTKVKTLTVGPAELRDQPFVVDPQDWLDLLGDGVDGTLGFEFFRRVDASIDFGAKQLELSESGSYKPPLDSTAVHFAYHDVLPQIDALIDSKPGVFVINTESRVALVTTSLWTYHNEPDVAFANMNDPGNEFELGRRIEEAIGSVRRADIAVSGRDVPEAVIVNSSEPSIGSASDFEGIDGDIGMALLNRFTITFGYQEQTMWLVPTSRSDKSEPFDRSGIIFFGWPDSHHVEIMKGSPAGQAGLQRFDELLAIDGKAASQWSLDALTQLLQSPAGTKVTLSYRHFEKQKTTAVRTVVITLKDYI